MLIVHSKKHAGHNPKEVRLPDGTFSEESPERVTALLAGIEALPGKRLVEADDFGLSHIARVHPEHFITFLRTAHDEGSAASKFGGAIFPSCFPIRSASHRPKIFVGKKGYYGTDVYTPILKGTWDAVYWSAQTAITAAQHLQGGGAFSYAMCRPAGHHAHADAYGGFCYLNNAAIAARYLQGSAGKSRVAVLDIDFHHGNGTQSIFYSDPTVLFCSLHGDPDFAYPYYSGLEQEKGEAEGLGFNLNFPLPLGTTDDAYMRALERAAAAILKFAPQYLVVSLGLDIAAGDPYGGFVITEQGMRAIGAAIAALGIPTVFLQEGGYLNENLSKNVNSFFSFLI